MNPQDFTAEEIIQAHQYLYYIGPNTAWSDYEYDKFCDKHGLPGNGGSDRCSDYPDRIRALANVILRQPYLWRWDELKPKN